MFGVTDGVLIAAVILRMKSAMTIALYSLPIRVGSVWVYLLTDIPKSPLQVSKLTADPKLGTFLWMGY